MKTNRDTKGAIALVVFVAFLVIVVIIATSQKSPAEKIIDQLKNIEMGISND